LACFFGRMNHVAGQGLEIGFDQWPGDRRARRSPRRSTTTTTTSSSPNKPDQGIDHHQTLGHAELGRSIPIGRNTPVEIKIHGFSSDFNQLPISPYRKHVQRIPYDVRLLLIDGWLKSAIVAGSTPLRDSKIVAMSFSVSKDTPSKPSAARNSLLMLQRCYYNVA
jgi:hypothetical protein